MDSLNAFNLLSIIVTSLGILIGFLLLFIQSIPERKRRVIYAYHQQLIDEKLKDTSKETTEAQLIKKVCDILEDKTIKIKLLNNYYSLISINLIIFSYTVGIFILSLYYLSLILCFGYGINIFIIFIFVILTLIDYTLLMPLAYWSCIQKYEFQS